MAEQTAPGRMTSRIRRRSLSIAVPLRRVRSFLAIYGRLAVEALAPYKGRLGWVIALAGLSAAARGGVIGGLAYFVALMEGASASIGLGAVTIEKGFLAIALVGGGVFILLICSSWAAYLSALHNRSLARRYHVSSAARVLEAFRDGRPVDFAARGGTPQHVVIRVTRDSLQSGIAVETLVRMIQPLAYILMGAAIVFYLDPFLTCLFIPMAALVIPVIYRQSARIHKDARKYYDSLARRMGRTVTEMIAGMDGSSIVPPDRKPIIRTLERSGPFRDFLDGFDKTRLATARMGLVASSFQSFFFAFVILVFGYYALHGVRSWGMMIGYVGGLFFLMNSLQTLLAHLATLNRFYPQVRELYRVLDTVHQRDATPSLTRPIFVDEICLQAKQELANSLSHACVRPGDWVAYQSVAPLTRLSFRDFVRPLQVGSNCREDLWTRADFVSSRYRVTGVTISEALGGVTASCESAEEAKAAFRDLGIFNEMGSLPSGLETEITDDIWDGLSRPSRAFLQIVFLLRGSGLVVFLDAKMIRSLTSAMRRILPNLLADRFVFVAVDWGPIPDLDIRHYVVADADSIVGIGDPAWFEVVKEEAKARYEGEKERSAVQLEDSDLVI